MSTTKRVLLVDLKLFKYSHRYLFLFVFFYKFRTKRRKEFARPQKRGTFSKMKKHPKAFSFYPVNNFKL